MTDESTHIIDGVPRLDEVLVSGHQDLHWWHPDRSPLRTVIVVASGSFGVVDRLNPPSVGDPGHRTLPTMYADLHAEHECPDRRLDT